MRNPDHHHPAYSEALRVHEAREECRRIIEEAREGRRLGTTRERSYALARARTDSSYGREG